MQHGLCNTDTKEQFIALRQPMWAQKHHANSTWTSNLLTVSQTALTTAPQKTTKKMSPLDSSSFISHKFDIWGLAYLYDESISPSIYERKFNSIKLYLNSIYYNLRLTTLKYKCCQKLRSGINSITQSKLRSNWLAFNPYKFWKASKVILFIEIHGHVISVQVYPCGAASILI